MLSLILPCHNEGANIERVLREVFAHFAEQTETTRQLAPVEIVVIDDGSSDDTAEVALRVGGDRRLFSLVRHENNRGYGAALRSGFEAAQGEFILVIDGDGQYSITDVDILWKALRAKQADIVSGYRPQRADSSLRRLYGWLWTRLMSLTLGIRLRDLGCGLKLFRASVLKRCRPFSAEGAFIWAEIAYELRRNNARFVEAPVQHLERQYGIQRGACPAVVMRAICEWGCFFARKSFGAARLNGSQRFR